MTYTPIHEIFTRVTAEFQHNYVDQGKKAVYNKAKLSHNDFENPHLGGKDLKGYRIFAAVFLALGLTLGAFTLWLSLEAPKADPVILELDPAAGETADAFLQEISQGELDQIGRAHV